MELSDQEKWPGLEEPLLNTEDQGHRRLSIDPNGNEPTVQPRYKHSKKHVQLLICVLALAYTPLLILYISLYWKYIAIEKSCRPSDLFPSLARSKAVIYETRPLQAKLHENVFVGDPRPELDAAWHELFEDIRIRVSLDDLQYYNLTSIPLADGSGYAAELGVHHELHCLKKIRHWIYKDYYLVNESAVELVEWKAHIDHCIEMLRESIMCRGDPSLTSFKWLPGKPPALTAVAEGHHQCVNWESLLSWVRERAVPIFDDGVLQAPYTV